MVPVNDPTGKRTSDLVRNYSMYLLPLPILAAVSGETSYMFAIEGVAATGYLVHLAEEFRRERSNDNARRVFKCSLWYLPLVLALFAFHRRRDSKDDSEESFVKQLKNQLRNACVHDLLVSPQGAALCPKTEAVNKTKQSLEK